MSQGVLPLDEILCFFLPVLESDCPFRCAFLLGFKGVRFQAREGLFCFLRSRFGLAFFPGKIVPSAQT